MNRRQFLNNSTLFAASAGPTSRTFGRPPFSGNSPVKAAFAERDISPLLGMEQPGGYGKSYHTKFHDPCKVRVALFDDGQNRVVLAGLDIGMLPRDLVQAARKEIRQRCGIPEGAILVGASHSHSSGPVGIEPGQYDHASPLVQELAYEKSTCSNPDYSRHMREQLVRAVCEANEFRTPAYCGFGVGHEDKVAFNRRLRMKNGLTYSHPRPGNPDTLDYAGPIDPQVGVIGAWNSNGKLTGCVVNYACHATTNPGGISANWIYYLEKTIRGIMGPDVTVVFLQGDCGDVTQVDNLSPYARPGGEKEAQFVGGRVGAETVKVLLSVQPGSLAPVKATSKLLNIKRRVPSPERVKKCLELVQKDPQEVGRTEWTFAKEIVLLDALLAKEPTVEVEVQAVQVGPSVFVTNPAEMFCQFGLDLKDASPFPITCPVELANGCVGYVPTEEAMSETGGGYETRLTSYSNLEVTAGRQMTDVGIELTRSMEPGRIPEPPKAEPFRGPWSYGNVPPELS